MWRFVGVTEHATVKAVGRTDAGADAATLAAGAANIAARVDASRLHRPERLSDVPRRGDRSSADRRRASRRRRGTRLECALRHAEETGMHFEDAELMRLRAHTFTERRNAVPHWTRRWHCPDVRVRRCSNCVVCSIISTWIGDGDRAELAAVVERIPDDCVLAGTGPCRADPVMTTVAVLGGGVGGLTAAHELADRGFDVTVLEWREAFGGKARSMDVPGSATGGRKPLPGEHGFRFFPGFYRHIPDTMSPHPEREPHRRRPSGPQHPDPARPGRRKARDRRHRRTAVRAERHRGGDRVPAGRRDRRPRPAGRVRRIRDVPADPAVRVR